MKRAAALVVLGALVLVAGLAALAGGGAAGDAADPVAAPGPGAEVEPTTTTTRRPALPTTTLTSAPAPDRPVGEQGSAGFVFTIGPVDPQTQAKMGATWAPGCPVLIEDLRHVTVTHYGFDGAVHTGEILVAADVAESLRGPFRTVYDLRYPIQVLTVTDGVDVPWDESTAFNCRRKVGKASEWSEHSYGRAIDINPVQNPYVGRSSIVPEDGREYVDRSRTDAGVLHSGDPVVAAFEAAGWRWGGDWSGTTKDYMHFSTTGQ